MNFIENSSGSRTSYAKVRRAMKGKAYTFSLSASDARPVQAAVNQGIDAHLEACFCPERGDQFEWKAGKLHGVVSVESLPTLLRRLFEMGDDAANLAEDMLSTLGFDECGNLGHRRE